MKKLLMICLLLVAVMVQVNAQNSGMNTHDKSGYYKIGEKSVDLKLDKDEIMVYSPDRFQSIKIKVQKEPIHLISIDVYYEDGGIQNVAIGSEIKVAGESQVYRLTHSDKDLQKVVLKYRTATNAQNTKAVVELWGLKPGTPEKTSK